VPEGSATHLIPSRKKKWQAQEKIKKLQNKKNIQELFKNEMGVLVDKGNPVGSETSKDGNTESSSSSSSSFFFNIRENLLELLVSTKTLFANLM
jgi:hypothetical protein